MGSEIQPEPSESRLNRRVREDYSGSRCTSSNPWGQGIPTSLLRRETGVWVSPYKAPLARNSGQSANGPSVLLVAFQPHSLEAATSFPMLSSPHRSSVSPIGAAPTFRGGQRNRQEPRSFYQTRDTDLPATNSLPS